MTPHTITCSGLDGSDPLTAMATFGVLTVGARAGVVDALHWCWQGGWRPVFTTTVDRQALTDLVLDTLVGTSVARSRDQLEQEEARRKAPASVPEAGAPYLDPAVERGARKAAREAKTLGREHDKALKTRLETVEKQAREAVRRLHPVTAYADHLADVLKGGLSQQTFATLALASDAAPYLAGLACDNRLGGQQSRKTIIARTPLSFANNGSGKQLLKDFANLACRVTAPRVDDALFGPGRIRDEITGLGWDPASQRSYALQFADPQLRVECQAAHHALAFLGLACFTTVPSSPDRATVGVATLPVEGDARAGREAAADDDDDVDQIDEVKASGGRRVADHLTWPIWESPLAPDDVRALLARREFAEPVPPAARCRAMGISAVLRSRRFSLSKRFYLAPSVPVFG